MSVTRVLLYAAAAAVAVGLPLVLAEARPAFVGMSYGRTFLPFELLGSSGGVVVLLVAWLELRRRRPAGVREWLVFAVPFLLLLHFLTLTSEYAQRRFDYDCYEYAGRALLAGESPYRVGLIYLYPPLTAEVFAAAHMAVAGVSEALGASGERDLVWDRVFYLYQCAQLLLVLGAYGLCVRFASAAGLDAWWMPLLVGALVVFDNAVFRTLRHGQVNLWLLDLTLLGLLLARARPAVSGFALAVAAHVKLYPLIALAPLAAAERRRAVVFAGAGFALLVLATSGGGRDLSLWAEYLDLLRAGFPGEIAFRNNSLHSLLYNTDRLLLGGGGTGPFVTWGVRGATLLFGAWFLWRLTWRERLRREVRDVPALEARHFAGHVSDALAFALLVSPSVWEHHYVMALPLAILGVAARGRDRPGAVALAIFAMLAMPTADVFPLSYHRLAGMLALLVLTSPRRYST